MNKKIIITIIVIVIVILSVSIIVYTKKENKSLKNNNKNMETERTGWAKDIPSSYKNSSTKKGSIEKVKYETIDYTNNKKITKQAVVYLPYGYDKNSDKKYNIFYLMHGWSGHAGDFFEYSNIINILDNMIENKDIEPLIVVSATFDAENKGQDWSRSVEELEPFHFDFENALMPYI